MFRIKVMTECQDNKDLKNFNICCEILEIEDEIKAVKELQNKSIEYSGAEYKVEMIYSKNGFNWLTD